MYPSIYLYCNHIIYYMYQHCSSKRRFSSHCTIYYLLLIGYGGYLLWQFKQINHHTTQQISAFVIPPNACFVFVFHIINHSRLLLFFFCFFPVVLWLSCLHGCKWQQPLCSPAMQRTKIESSNIYMTDIFFAEEVGGKSSCCLSGVWETSDDPLRKKRRRGRKNPVSLLLFCRRKSCPI